MNRSDYIQEAVSKALKLAREEAISKEDHDEYNEALWRKSLQENDLDEEMGNQWDEHRRSYLAGCLASSAEISGDRFQNNLDLKERNADIYLGRHDRVRAVFSREYVDEDDETVNNHMLIEHTSDNNHLEGVQRMATAYFSFTNSAREE